MADENGQTESDSGLGAVAADNPMAGSFAAEPFAAPIAPGNFSEAAPPQPGTEQMGVWDRLRLRYNINFGAARSNSLAGSGAAGQEAQDVENARKGAAFTDAEIPGVSDFRSGNPFAFSDIELGLTPASKVEQQRKALEDVEADAIAYKASGPYKGFLEGAASLAGQVAGGGLSPENLIFPEIKIGSVAWRAAHPLIADMVGFGLGQSIIQGAVDPFKQANEIRAGLRKEYDPVETSLAVPTNFMFGAGITALGRGASVLYRAGVDAWGGRLTKNIAPVVPEIRPPVEPEPPIAPPDLRAPKPAVPEPGPAVLPRPEPAVPEGMVRLYRADVPNPPPPGEGSRIVFTPELARAAETPGMGHRASDRTQISYVDVPENVALAARSSDGSIGLPAEFAKGRSILPEPPKAEGAPSARPGTTSETTITINGKTTTTKTGEPTTVAAEANTPKIELQAARSGAAGHNVKIDGELLLDARGNVRVFKSEEAARKAAAKEVTKRDPVNAEDDALAELDGGDIIDLAVKQGVKVEDLFNAAGTKSLPKRELIAKLRAAQMEAGLLGRRAAFAEQPGSAAPHGTSRPQAGVPSNLPTEQISPVQRLQDAIRDVANALDIVVRKGGVGKGNVASFDPKDWITRLTSNTHNSFVDFAHELGHYIEMSAKTPIQAFMRARETQLKAIGGPEVQKIKGFDGTQEGFSEFVSGYVTNRNAMIARDAQLVRDFRDVMEQHAPEILQSLDRATAAWEAHQAAPSRAPTMIVSRTEIPERDVRDPLKTGPVGLFFRNLYTNYVNRQHPMSVALRYLAEQYESKYGHLLDLPPDKDPVKLLQIFGRGGHQMGVMDLTYGVQDAHTLTPNGPSFFSILRRVALDANGKETGDHAVVAARMKAFDDYLVARWDRALREQMARGERPELKRPPTRNTDGDIAQKIKEYEQFHPEFPALAEEVYAFQKELVKKEFDAGMRTRDSFNELMHAKNHEYVPLRRDMTGITDDIRAGAGRGAPHLETLGQYAMHGSDRDVLSPTESVMLRTFTINDQMVENWLKLSIRDLVRMVGGKEGGRIAEEIPNTQLRAMDIDVQDAIFKSALKNGWLPQDARDLAQQVMSDIGPEARIQLYRAEAIKAGTRPVIFGWDQGERFALQLPDGDFGRQLQNVMDSMGPQGAKVWAQSTGVLMEILGSTAGTLRAGATTTLTFAVKNTVRDAFMQYLMTPEASALGTLTFANHIKGGKSFVTGDDFYRMYTSLEGIRGGIATHNIGDTRTVAEMLRKAGVPSQQVITMGAVKDVLNVMEISESAGRIGLFRAVYEANIAMGRSERYAMFDAAQKARDFIDYGRVGSKMEQISRLVPFLNANIQGLDKFVRTYGGTSSNPGMLFGKAVTEQQAQIKAELQRALIPRATALAAISAAIAYIYEDDPVYQRIPIQLRSQNWIFRVPFIKAGVYDMAGGGKVELPEGMQGAWMVIPKPWEPATIFNLAERAVQFAHTNDSAEASRFFTSLRYTMGVPNLLEFPLVKTNYGLASNYDSFFDRPIIPDSLQKVAPHLQSNEYTNKFYVAVAHGLNKVWDSKDAHDFLRKHVPVVGAALGAMWSPMEAQYLMQGVLGDVPRELGGIGGMARSLFNGEAVKIEDVPGLRGIMRDKMAGGEPLRELYNQVGQHDGRLMSASESFKKLVADGDFSSAQMYFSQLDSNQRDYVRLQTTGADPLARALHPLDRAKEINSVVRNVRNGLLTEGGLATYNDKNTRIKLEPGTRDVVIQALNEVAAIEARNSLIVQDVPGFRGLPVVDTQPYMQMIEAASPELARDVSARMGAGKVLPISTIQEYWPQAQRALRIGGDRQNLQFELKALGQAAAGQGFFGGAIKSGRGVIDSQGVRVKRGAAQFPELPAEAGAGGQ